MYRKRGVYCKSSCTISHPGLHKITGLVNKSINDAQNLFFRSLVIFINALTLLKTICKFYDKFKRVVYRLSHQESGVGFPAVYHSYTSARGVRYTGISFIPAYLLYRITLKNSWGYLYNRKIFPYTANTVFKPI